MADLGPKALYRTKLTYSDDDADNDPRRFDEDELGMIRWVHDSTNGLKCYKFVEVASTSAALTNGAVVTYTDTIRTLVSDDISEQHPNWPAGVAIGAIAVGEKGWIQVQGYHSAIDTDGGDDIAAGDSLIVDPSVDATCDSVAQGTAVTHYVLGIAQAADVDANNTVAGWITCLPLA